jgi:hypothetical protein
MLTPLILLFIQFIHHTLYIKKSKENLLEIVLGMRDVCEDQGCTEAHKTREIGAICTALHPWIPSRL